MRDMLIDLPKGMLGNPLAVPRCTRQEFEGFQPRCSPDTQVGIVHAKIFGLGQASGALYNIVAPHGMPAQFGFSLAGLNALQNTSVLTEEGYGLRVATYGFPKEITELSATVWGDPANPGHDPQRGREGAEGQGSGTSSTAPDVAFLTLPATCSAPLTTTVSVDTTLNPGDYVSATASSLDSGGNVSSQNGCDEVPFTPQVSAQPTTSSADSSSGLDFQLKLPNEGLLNPNGIAETEPVKTEVVLPGGVAINPSAAGGLGVCTPAEYQSADGEPGQGCPESSKVGTLVAKTSLLEEPIEGSVYLAAPHANPFDSLLALYIVARAPERGVLIKQAGEVAADPSTGQLTTTFDGLPPLPYSSFVFDLRGGPRAPLTMPSACGTYTTVTRLYPFSDPTAPVERDSNFQITSGAGGGACPASEAQQPNSPGFEAGTTTPLAGSYSPFVLHLSREDGSQRFSALNVTLPEGLTGEIAGVAQCSDAQLAAAAARDGFGGGTSEQASPSCPASSELGTVTVGTGSGTPIYVGGHAYLAGPYKGAPFSLAIITPAIAGPFDLGNVVVRSGLYINPETTQVTVKSDPLPTILAGIPLDIRSVAISMTRPGFMLNPTSCQSMSLTGEAATTAGQTAALSDRFQVGGCAGLAFKPSLSASTQGKAGKANGASLVVKIAANPGEANIRKVNLQLPVTLPSRLTTLQKACTEAQFNANPADCPAESVIGSGTAHTPILQVPLSGPAYIVSHGGAAFPDVEFVLQADERGGDVEIVLDGGTQIKKGITYSNFETVPDAPISSFETVLPEGPHSILTANLPVSENYNLCGQSLQMPTTLTGQNGAVLKQTTPIEVTGCAPAIRVAKSTVKGNTATLVVSVPSAGKLTATSTGLTSATKTVSAGKSITLEVKLNKKERAFLARHPRRRLKLHVKLQFVPKKGTRLSTAATVLIG